MGETLLKITKGWVDMTAGIDGLVNKMIAL